MPAMKPQNPNPMVQAIFNHNPNVGYWNCLRQDLELRVLPAPHSVQPQRLEFFVDVPEMHLE
jgi:hypothetical protein